MELEFVKACIVMSSGTRKWRFGDTTLPPANSLKGDRESRLDTIIDDEAVIFALIIISDRSSERLSTNLL